MPLHHKLAQLNPIVTFLGFLDTPLLIPILALYATSLGSDIVTVGIIIGAYSITNTITNILGGRWVDKVGYKAPLITGLCGDAIAMVAYALCQVPWHLVLVRAFHGLSGGLVGPATMAFTAHHASPTEKGKAMSIYGVAIATGTLIGFGVGGTVASRLGYHLLFYIGSALLVLGVLLACLMPQDRANVQQERPTHRNLGDMLQLATTGKRPVSYLSIFAQYFSFGGVVALLPLSMATLGMEAFHVGMVLAIFSLMFIIVQSFSGRISDRAGRLKPIAIALALGVMALIAMPLAGNFPALTAVMIVYGIAYGILFPAASALLIDHVTPEEYGITTGLFHALITIGVAVGAPLIGWIAQFTGLRVGLALAGSIFLAALALTLTHLRKERSCNVAS